MDCYTAVVIVGGGDDLVSQIFFQHHTNLRFLTGHANEIWAHPG